MLPLAFALAVARSPQPLSAPPPPPPSVLYTPSDVDFVRDAITKLPNNHKGIRDGSSAGLTAIAFKSAALTGKKITPQRYPAIPLSYAHSQCDWVYMELCPKYLSMSYDVSYYAARKAWPLLAALVGWHEVKTQHARDLKAPLRNLSGETRYGRHLFIPRPNLDLILECLEFPECRAATKAPVIGGEIAVALRKLPLPGPKLDRSVSAKCPNLTGAHKNGDSSPSLVVWMNADRVSGGAMCMVCRPPGSQSEHLTFRVRFSNNRAILSAPVGANWTIPRDPKPGQGLQSVAPGLQRRRRRKHQVVASNGRRLLTNGRREQENSLQHHQEDQHHSEEVGSHLLAGTWDRSCPVGGCVLSEEEHTQGSIASGESYSDDARKPRDPLYVGAKLTARPVPRGEGDDESDADRPVTYDRVRSTGHRLHGGPLQFLRRAETTSKGMAATRKATDASSLTTTDTCNPGTELARIGPQVTRETTATEHGQKSAMLLPIPVASVSAMRARDFGEIPLLRANGKKVSIPTAWEPVVQQWILLDLDDFRQLPTDEKELTQLAQKIIRIVRRDHELSGRAAVVQTGPAGLQIWCELREQRETPRVWFAQDDTRAWYGHLAARVLRGARSCGARRGELDASSCSAGRFGRRPSWRLLDDGTAFRSRLVADSTLRVPGREARPD